MNNQTKETVTVSANDIKWAKWIRVARNYRLRVGLKDNRRRESFDGFLRDVCYCSYNEDLTHFITVTRTMTNWQRC